STAHRDPLRLALPDGDLRPQAPSGPRLLCHADPPSRPAHRYGRSEDRSPARRPRGGHVPSRAGRTTGSFDAPRHRGRGPRPGPLHRRARRRVAEGDRFVILPALIARARANSGALWLPTAPTFPTVLGSAYPLAMPPLLT